MSVKKQHFKTKPLCKVTFTAPKQIAASATTVHLVGDFNDWDSSITPMKRHKNGSFTAALYLKPDCGYQFRYLVDGVAWENDPEAEKYLPNPYGGENSVVIV
jgi:1,4-alpha-glucan branching enzyme